MIAAYEPFFGAHPSGSGTFFRLWAPAAKGVTLVLESGNAAGEHKLSSTGNGVFTAHVAGVRAGDFYRYRLDGGPPLPDPASRFQPFGVHGPSEVIDHSAYSWHDRDWSGTDPARAVIYELHVGTFTRAGTFAAAAAKLPYLRDLGVTVIELMPVADFPGNRNWGYDGVCLYAPARAYGRPDDLRHLVDQAHGAGLAMLLDVVYNHFGPDGAYIHSFAPQFFTSRHSSAWGDGVNLDGPESRFVRRFILDNAAHWITDYHMDGLRLDATHALADESPTHIVGEISDAVRPLTGRPTIVIAEDHRNDAMMLVDREHGGWGLDGVWADDFHHVLRRILAGDYEGYYEDFDASVPDLAATLHQGWLYTGQYSRYLGRARGTDPSGLPQRKFVICLQNHDQIGNRALGDRLHHAIGLAAYRAASALWLLAPQTPLLFMGQEWAATTPFSYFTDHNPELGEQIVKGRRREFENFSQFRDPEARDRIPDPQAPETFEGSRLNWDEREREPHAGIWRLYHRCLELRRTWLALAGPARERAAVDTLGEDTVLIRYEADRSQLWVISRLRGAGPVELPVATAQPAVILTTEDAQFCQEGSVPEFHGRDLRFSGPATVVLARDR